MIKQATKPKRGERFIYDGNAVWLEIIKPNGTLLVCDNEARRLEDNYFEVKLSDLKQPNEARKGIANKVKKLTDKQKTEKDLLNEFFDEMAKKIPLVCDNCGEILCAYNKFAKRSVTAHILAKSLFPSIATNPNNVFFLGVDFLGGCNCHTIWDSTIDKRIKMSIYRTALNRYEMLKPFLTGKEIDIANKLLDLA